MIDENFVCKLREKVDPKAAEKILIPSHLKELFDFHREEIVRLKNELQDKAKQLVICKTQRDGLIMSGFHMNIALLVIQEKNKELEEVCEKK